MVYQIQELMNQVQDSVNNIATAAEEQQQSTQAVIPDAKAMSESIEGSKDSANQVKDQADNANRLCDSLSGAMETLAS